LLPPFFKYIAICCGLVALNRKVNAKRPILATPKELTVNFRCSSEKSGHVPYRDSKLTRILQLSLGGNARTAIICTMSPALTHVEQSRNTLFFATCAKEVTNTAKVNMVRAHCETALLSPLVAESQLNTPLSIQVVSDKQLVKHLQTEVARLEAELRTPDRTSSSDILTVKIKQVTSLTKGVMLTSDIRGYIE
jgi:centromeric protein E